MQQGWFARAVLAAFVWLGVTAGLLRAADALPMPNPAPSPALAAAVPEQSLLAQPPYPLDHPPSPSTQTPFATGDVVYPGAPPKIVEQPHSVGGCIKRFFIKNVPICCWAHHNTLGCGNFASEFHFIFGSCRTFYGEPCFRGPPPPPVPVEYLNLYGPQGAYGPQGVYGSQAANDCHCP
jgi:hypothetical protein